MNRGLFPGWNRSANGVAYPAPRLTISGALTTPISSGNQFSGSLVIDGGLWPYRITFTGTPPPGLNLSPVLINNQLWKSFAGGYATTAGSYNFSVNVTSADGQTTSLNQSISVTSITYSTFNPSDKSIYIILSGSNLTAEHDTSGVGYASVRTTGKMLASNKTQCEFVITHVGPSPYAIVSIDDGTANISAIFQIASDVHGYGY